ncbi:alpha/beta hydrolase family protein [Catellatospora sp. KI3]|uniref:alpha/beta fold hydrolase n=1 Tax=Catellatospora sp. KI3 TaxID=3041620 RepID=UPI002482BAB1|nr:alpha/beta hydrolase family protein [Catellatospora sp. KI3]MDI1460797.1 alpha/beta hydrolase family protein [Catellatospora sp. KI3]
MAQTFNDIRFDVDGVTITALTKGRSGDDKPVIAALHGGTYTARYFDVDGSGHGSFMDVAADAGYQVISFDRPGYGGSTPLDPPVNTFERHAQLLNDAIGQAAGDRPVLLVGHSIGGMIALMVAGRPNGFRLIGASVTGMGAVIRAGGAAHALASLPADATVDLPYDQRDLVMFGPEGTFSAEGVAQAHGAYAPVPVRELIAAPQWADDILPGLAPRIQVPVHNALAEYDALWDSTPANVATFAGLLTAAPFVEASIARSVGHSIDHHILGHALHLRQLAFAQECQLWARRQDQGN